MGHDVTFVARLLPHQQTAAQMAAVARDKATNSQLRRLAAHIADEHSGQIAEMRVWLRQHNANPMPPPGPVQQMNRQDIEMLRDAQGCSNGPAVPDDDGSSPCPGVSKTEHELQHGRNSFAVNLARSNKNDQSNEIAKMNDLLAPLH